MTPTVSKGLATWAGLIAALGQYMAAVAVFLNDPDKATALGPLTTATATLLVVIVGRMSQAKALAKPAPTPLSLRVDGDEVARATAELPSGRVARAASTPRPMAEMSALDLDGPGDVRAVIGDPLLKPGREVPGGGVPREDVS